MSMWLQDILEPKQQAGMGFDELMRVGETEEVRLLLEAARSRHSFVTMSDIAS